MSIRTRHQKINSSEEQEWMLQDWFSLEPDDFKVITWQVKWSGKEQIVSLNTSMNALHNDQILTLAGWVRFRKL